MTGRPGISSAREREPKLWSERTEGDFALERALRMCRMGERPSRPDKLTEADSKGKITGLYFIHNPTTQLIKIGISLNVQKRIGDLECATGCSLELLGFHWGNRYAEGRLHRHFYRQRARGEWFSESAQLFSLAKVHDTHGIQRVFKKLGIRP